MDNYLENIDKLLNDLEINIKILIEGLNQHQYISLVSNDIFKSIINIIRELEKYDNKNLKELFVFFRAMLSHLNNVFNNKEYIYQSDMDGILKCLNDIALVRSKLDINKTYNKFFVRLESISRRLSELDSYDFLISGQISKDFLIYYENLINKLSDVIASIVEIRKEMDSDDFNNLKLDLNNILMGFKNNLKQIYFEIIKSNNAVAEPLLNKQKRNFLNENYTAILNDSTMYKEVHDNNKRDILVDDLLMLIKSLNSIITTYNGIKKIKRSNELNTENTNYKVEEQNVDIPKFVEDNYNEYRKSLNRDNSDTMYDKKVAAFITRFELLKRRLEKKKTYTKEEVKLYNKLESELDLLKKVKHNRIISSIKFNYYYKALNKRMKLSKKNSFRQVTNTNKKRK